MRRWASIILFVIGGFFVGLQVMMAFVKIPAEYSQAVHPLIYFTAIPMLFLLPATWLSPGERWRELGITLLIGAAVCIGSFAVTMDAPVEEGGSGGIDQLKAYVDWGQGWFNLSLIAFAGFLLLFVRGRGFE